MSETRDKEQQQEVEQDKGCDFSEVPGARVVFLDGGEAHAWTITSKPQVHHTREYDPYASF